MLLNLHVKNMALIDEIEVSFQDGLNILSGETGAGKSIIIGSIELALGGKMPKDVVGKFADHGLVELIFSIDDYVNNEKIKTVIDDMGIEASDGQIIISRKIINGKSIIKVNGETQTAVKLRELTTLLIDMHGQHEHESLLHKSKHLEILDEFAYEDLKDISEEYNKNYKEYKELLKKQASFTMDEDQRIRELSFIEYEVNEIEEAELKVGEDEALENDYKIFSNQEKIYESLAVAINEFSSGNGVSDKISAAISAMNSVANLDDRLGNIYNSLMDLDSICMDVSHAMSDYVDDISYNEEKANSVMKRLDLINKLKMKHGKTIEDVLNKYEELNDKLNELKDYENAKNAVEKQISEKTKTLLDLSNKMTKIRKDAAKKLSKDIISTLMDLNFLEVSFDVKFVSCDEFTPKGMDDVEFMISTNPGEELRPLKNVASGGELSRIMLGLKTILANKDEIDTLIFDEIDTGISGKTAGLVADKLGIISRNHQVICITHLPQIAAMADAHFVIEKNVVDDYTKTSITRLSEKGEIEELSRMLGGMNISDAVRENAKEMKEFAKANKNIQN
ncbi:MAG: DNA repair protein RecN [Lachnospiraceae bacterium]|nr:DNA repair protein RecN [Lachnospiraceae bacterium]